MSRAVRVYDERLCARACVANVCVRGRGSRAASGAERAGASDASGSGSERELKIKNVLGRGRLATSWAAGGLRARAAGYEGDDEHLV